MTIGDVINAHWEEFVVLVVVILLVWKAAHDAK